MDNWEIKVSLSRRHRFSQGLLGFYLYVPLYSRFHCALFLVLDESETLRALMLS